MITAIVQFQLPKPVSLEEAARMFESTRRKKFIAANGASASPSSTATRRR
jgi:hypothetical protein